MKTAQQQSTLENPMKHARLTEQQIREIFEENPRTSHVTEYPEGFVPNAYKWKIMRTRFVHTMKAGEINTSEEAYDAKRPYGKGARIVAMSDRGGRLASW